MISCDTNILFAALNQQSERHKAARSFMVAHRRNERFCLCEQVLMELYVLLRNPAVSQPALSAQAATAMIQRFRSNPSWRLVDVPGERELMDSLWKRAVGPSFARRRVFDARLALTLRHHGVEKFATRNMKDFQDFDFKQVWDPTG